MVLYDPANIIFPFNLPGQLYIDNLKAKYFSTKGLKYPSLCHVGCDKFSFDFHLSQLSLVSFTFNVHRHENRFRIIHEVITLKLF